MKKILTILCQPYLSFYHNSNLIWLLAKRNIHSRYKGSLLGLFWSFSTPILMLSIYAFVFSVVFKTRWPDAGISDSKFAFALVLFAGLIVYNTFSEIINSSLSSVVNHPNYVKKIVFPLEVLAFVSVISALFFCVLWFVIIVAGKLLFISSTLGTLFLLPLVILPLVLFTCGLSWILSSLYVYIRDLVHVVGLGMQVLFFMTPIFYSAEMLPEKFQTFLYLNPLTYVIEAVRGIVFFGKTPPMLQYFYFFMSALFVFHLGYWFFTRLKKGFSDVI